MSRGRVFSREFKIAVVREVLRGDEGVMAICRKHGLAQPVVLRWRHEVEARGDDAFIPRVADAVDARDLRISELEQLCGQLTLENRALKKGLSAHALRSGTR